MNDLKIFWKEENPEQTINKSFYFLRLILFSFLIWKRKRFQLAKIHTQKYSNRRRSLSLSTRIIWLRKKRVSFLRRKISSNAKNTPCQVYQDLSISKVNQGFRKLLLNKDWSKLAIKRFNVTRVHGLTVKMISQLHFLRVNLESRRSQTCGRRLRWEILNLKILTK